MNTCQGSQGGHGACLKNMRLQFDSVPWHKEPRGGFILLRSFRCLAVMVELADTQASEACSLQQGVGVQLSLTALS